MLNGESMMRCRNACQGYESDANDNADLIFDDKWYYDYCSCFGYAKYKPVINIK